MNQLMELMGEVEQQLAKYLPESRYRLQIDREIQAGGRLACIQEAAHGKAAGISGGEVRRRLRQICRNETLRRAAAISLVEAALDAGGLCLYAAVPPGGRCSLPCGAGASGQTPFNDHTEGAPAMEFSVIVPIYKVEAYLPRCVDSIFGLQSFPDFEVILVDDGSPDRCGELCDQYRADPRVRVIHKENGGLVSARQAGMSVASGDYIVHVDGDEIGLPRTCWRGPTGPYGHTIRMWYPFLRQHGRRRTGAPD